MMDKEFSTIVRSISTLSVTRIIVYLKLYIRDWSLIMGSGATKPEGGK